MKTPAEIRREENVKMIELMAQRTWREFSDINKIKDMATGLGWSLRKFQEVVTRVHSMKQRGIL